MTTISVTEHVKEALVRVASELQLKLGRKVDLNEAISFLLSQRIKRPELLDKACRPTAGFDDVYKELIEERIRDEERARGRYGL